MGIKHQFARSSIWIILGRGSTNLAGFLVFTLLARLLGPADFGLITFAALFVELTRPLALAGFPQALIQRPDWDHEVSSNAFWANVGLAAFIALILWAAFTPFLVATYNPNLKWVLPTLAITLVVDAMRAPQEALLQRQFRFKLLAQRSVLGTVVGGIVGVAMAYTGFGIWALVMSRVTTSVLMTLTIWLTVRWKPKATFSWETVKPLFGYGVPLTGAALFGLLNRRIPDLLIGSLLGAAPFGIFRVGARVVDMLNDAIIQPMNATALSALSRVHEKGSVANAYLRITTVCGLVSFPVYYGAAVTANDFVSIFVGSQWHEAGNVMAMFALFGGAGTMGYFSGPALSAAGKTNLVFWMTLISLASNVVITLLAIRYGVAAVALGLSARAYLVIPLHLQMLKRGLNLRPMDVMKGILPPFFCAVAMACILLVLKAELLTGLHPLPRLAIMVLTGALLYLFFLLVFARKYAEGMKGELGPVLTPIVERVTRRLRRNPTE